MVTFASQTGRTTDSTPSVSRPAALAPQRPLAAASRTERLPTLRDLIPPGGAPLEKTVREPVEKQLGFDFSKVRIHSGAGADRMARGLDARAYTLGEHVVFRAGEFAPETGEGRRTLMHELAHVAQQGGEPVVAWNEIPSVSRPDDALEREANELADSRINSASPQRIPHRVTRRVAERPTVWRRPAGGNTFGNWDVDTVPMHAAAAGGDYNYRIRIMFQPDATTVNSPEIAFVQAANIANTATGAWALPNTMDISNRQSAAGWSIDSVTRRGWVGYDDAGNPYAVPRPGGLPARMIVEPGSAPTPLRNAVTRDWPGWNVPNLSWSFDTAAVAKRGPDVGTVYGAVTWGFIADGVNHLNPLPIQFHDAPGPAWQGAADAWNRQARGPAAGRVAPNQQPLPNFILPQPEPAAP
jgi:hypothetical protein